MKENFITIGRQFDPMKYDEDEAMFRLKNLPVINWKIMKGLYVFKWGMSFNEGTFFYLRLPVIIINDFRVKIYLYWLGKRFYIDQ